MSDHLRDCDEISLGALAERISIELDVLLELSLALQDAMSCCATLARHKVKTLSALQGVDRISQSLCDLARLTGEIGMRTPDSVLLDRRSLDASLRLRDLSVRLLAQEDHTMRATKNNRSRTTRDPGDVLLF